VKADPEPRDVEVPHGAPVGRGHVAIRLLLALAVGTVLYLAHAAVVPVALAVLFALILTAPVEALHRQGVPRGVAAALILLVLIGIVGVALNLLWTPAQHWWSTAPQTLRVIERKVQPLSRLIGRLEALTDRAGEMATAPKAPASPGGPQAAPETQPSAETHVAAEVIDQTRTAVVSILTTTVLALFLLSGGPPMLARLTAGVSKDLPSKHALTVINAVRNEVSRYYACLALINLGLGLATAAVTTLLGMPNPLLWGAMAAILNFIPYVGSAITLLLLIIVAFVSFDGLGRVAAVGASYLFLTTLEGQLVQPLVIGRRLELNPMIVFLSLWFGGWFWGIPGIVIAVPSLVTLKVVAEHSRHGKAMTEVLSPNQDGRFKALTARASKSLAKKPAKLST
jgi:predicted PurR-regulated permease PerM